MKLFHATSLALIALVSTALTTSAQINLSANLTPGQETTAPVFTSSLGGSRAPSFGVASLTLNANFTTLTMTITILNIDVTGTQTLDTNDNLTAAHIHGPAAVGSSVGVIWGFFGTPDNDNNPDSISLTPFPGGVGGTFFTVWNAPEGQNTTLAAQLNNILNGLTYLNFHTSQNGGGEIRGQILVPEPSTFALFAAGLAGAVASLWWRRRA